MLCHVYDTILTKTFCYVIMAEALINKQSTIEMPICKQKLIFCQHKPTDNPYFTFIETTAQKARLNASVLSESMIIILSYYEAFGDIRQSLRLQNFDENLFH